MSKKILVIDDETSILDILAGILSDEGFAPICVDSAEKGILEDKIYCVYTAPNEEMVREHAMQGGFPANAVSAVTTVIDPSTAK